MIQVCKFDPASDIEQVVPALSVDVSEMMATGVVASTGDSTPYTKETDIKEVGHYLKDKIQTAISAMKLQASLSSQASPAGTTTVKPGSPAE